jgi:hypothetical protein
LRDDHPGSLVDFRVLQAGHHGYSVHLGGGHGDGTGMVNGYRCAVGSLNHLRPQPQPAINAHRRRPQTRQKKSCRTSSDR